MDNFVLKDILAYANDKLTAAYGFCALYDRAADGTKGATIYCNDGLGTDIRIEITVIEEGE